MESILFDESEFTKMIFNVNQTISFILFSDGYQDQFGGENGRKLLSKNFKKILIEAQNSPISEHKEILESKTC